MRFAITVALIFTIYCVHAEDPSPPRLLVHKQLLNKYVVEGRDVIVNYNIYNIGESPAYNIQLNDVNFPSEKFERIIGFVRAKIHRLGPNMNVSHTAIVRPTTTGLYNFTAAEVSYHLSEDNRGAIQTVYSTEPGEAYIAPARDFDRKFSPHTMDWAAFAVMTLPSLGIPFLLWYRSKTKYETIMKQKKH